MIYSSIIQSNLNYCILAWGYNCGRPKILQKKAIRVITNSRYNSHTSPLFKKLDILRLEDMFKINMLKWYYQYINKHLPQYFNDYKILKQQDIHTHNTRNKTDVTQPSTRIQAAKKCLRNHISVVIRATPNNILEKVNTHSYKGFVKYTKNMLLQEYTTECTINDCYICNRQ